MSSTPTRLFTVFLLAPICSNIWAQSPEPTPDVVVLEEVTVQSPVAAPKQARGFKTDTRPLDVPQSFSVFTAEQFTAQGLNSIGDMVDYTPGVNTSQGEGHRDAVVFRGIRSTADFYIDGLRDDVQYYRPLYNVEQVEILRGPNALLFGRGGTGGVINRVMKKADPDSTFTGYGASVDTFGATSFELDRNMGLGSGMGFRLNLMFESLDNHRDHFDGERIGVNPTFRIQLTEQTTLDLSYEYLDHERFIDRGIPTGSNGRPVEAFKDIVFGDTEENETTLEAHLLRASLEHRFSENLKGNFDLFYGEYDKSYVNLYASSYDQAASPDVVTLDGYVDNTERTNLILSGYVTGEYETGSLGHTLLIGGEVVNTSSDQDRYNTFWDTTSDDNEVFSVTRPLGIRGGVGVNADGVTATNDYTADLNDDTHVDVEVLSFYVQDEIALSDTLDLVIGARADRFDIEVYDVPADDTESRTDEEISPRAGLVYKPMETLSVYTSYSQTFLPRSGEQYANLSGDRDRLDPDEFTNLEAGVRWEFREGLAFSAAVFESEKTSPEVSDADAALLVEVESEITGFEAQLQGRLTDNWYVAAGYSYLDGEQVDQSGGTGLRPRELPENTFSIWNQFRVSENLGLGLGVVYQDESYINNSNTAVLPSYTRVDAAAFYKVSDHLRLQVNIENLTDELYFPNAHSTHQASVGAPINARFSVRGTF